VDFSKPVPLSLIFEAIGLIFIFVGIGLMVVRYYKKKQER